MMKYNVEDKKRTMEERKVSISVLGLIMILSSIFIIALFANMALAQTPTTTGTETIVEPTYCCEKTTNGLYCQNAPESQCASGFSKSPTSCRSTSYCKPGTCYDSTEGTCMSNTPKIVCNSNNGTWADSSPAQCDLGCCVLGDQAAFVPLVRCKRLSAFLGLETNYRNDIKDEVSCVLSVQNQDRGACVFTKDFEKTCKMTTRADCLGVTGNSSTREFHKGKLCTAEELGTNCGKTDKTTCLEGKEEVYYLDTCGNPANIYDSSKYGDANYWAEIKDKAESCNPDSSNAGSGSCGNCNYALGSFCRDSKSAKAGLLVSTDYVCADLNCYDTSNGNDYKHGESWCVYTDKGTINQGTGNSVGSRFYKHICNNGEEVLEPCADYRQEECIQDALTASDGKPFYQAACRVNRWQDCIAQDERVDCENTDKRDCIWREYSISMGLTFMGGETVAGICLPKNAPGLKFWGESILTQAKQGPASYSDYLMKANATNAVSTGTTPAGFTPSTAASSSGGSEAEKICAIGNSQCIVTLTKSLFDKEWKCSENCECWDEAKKSAKQSWIDPHVEVCQSLGDCGPKVTWLGSAGYKSGYNISVKDIKSSDSGGGGLFG